MKKIILFIMFLCLLVLPVVVTSNSQDLTNSSEETADKSEERKNNSDIIDTPSQNSMQKKPPVVDHFACSDYCPGPEKDYMVKIYEGIKDKEECLKLGGRPATYYGWGEFHICMAE